MNGSNRAGHGSGRMAELYNTRLLRLAASIPCTMRLDAPDATATLHSPLCGNRITVEIVLNGDRVTGYGQEVRACLVGQAAASVLGSLIVGLTVAEFRRGHALFRTMLRDRTPPPAGLWHPLEALAPVADVPVRHRSALLPFDAVEAALARVAGLDGCNDPPSLFRSSEGCS
ncbi:iron-sulfur cluster assembly scaffold protein [Azospirillum sp. INR13]|uniref:iron-sulfur cluster assembly scaffold protein n=1 Tax=Azospirillum sp. INR13 TaxID=2596919 RepID=UPI0018920FC8|nr:iron-sulfur cluster assembly scaffold protein [Azospirillum sp. INR13]